VLFLEDESLSQLQMKTVLLDICIKSNPICG